MSVSPWMSLAAEAAARRLVLAAPPCDEMTFGPDGRVREGFTALVVGLAPVGRAVLRRLVMNGQFCGGTFRAVVVEPHPTRDAQDWCRALAPMLEAYHIRCLASPLDQEALAALLRQAHYLVLCDDNATENDRWYQPLKILLTTRQKPLTAASVTEEQVLLHGADDAPLRRTRDRAVAVDDPVLWRQAEAMACAVNATYLGDGVTPAQARAAWAELDDFSRDSCRASADYIPALLRAAGIPAPDLAALNEETLAELERRLAAATADPVLRDRLGQAEHDRWVAFHRACGVEAMPFEEMERRAAAGIPGFHKDLRPGGLGGRHACLVPWEALDELSQRYNRVRPAGSAPKDFKQLDIDNVLAIPRVYRAAWQALQD